MRCCIRCDVDPYNRDWPCAAVNTTDAGTCDPERSRPLITKDVFTTNLSTIDLPIHHQPIHYRCIHTATTFIAMIAFATLHILGARPSLP